MSATLRLQEDRDKMLETFIEGEGVINFSNSERHFHCSLFWLVVFD